MRVGPRRLAVAAIGAVVMLTASGCTANEAFFFDMPQSATKEGDITANLWQGSWIAAWAVGIVTWALMLWAAFAYRRRKNAGAPAQTRYNIPIEILYTHLNSKLGHPEDISKLPEDTVFDQDVAIPQESKSTGEQKLPQKVTKNYEDSDK